MTWPVVVFWIFFVWGLSTRRPVLIYLFFGSAPFGSLAVLPVEAVGGVNLLPQVVCASALLLRLALDADAARDALGALLSLRRLALLGAFLAVSIVVTLFAPRIFAGMVDVVAISGALDGPRPLVAGTHNVTQTAYLMLSVLTVVVFAIMARTPTQLATIRNGVLLGGMVMVATGLVSIAVDAVGLGDLLTPFRTVSYVLLTEDEALGARRLAGLMPEASAFGAFSVLSGSTIALLYPCYEGWRRSAAAATAIALLVLGAMSTSSTAYVGLGAGFAMIGCNWLRRLMTPQAPRPTSGRIEFVVGAVTLTGLLALVLVDPRPLNYAADMLELALFQKVNSSSYIERMSWNETSINGLIASYGIGVGLGSARASNWFIALASNTGVLGAVLMLGFVVQTFLRRSALHESVVTEMMWGLKLSLIVSLVLGGTSGTSADFGVGNAAIYGVIAGLAFATRPAFSVAPAGRMEPRPARA